ncbi:MAG: LysM peptidoglycan-binding domain-containing protein [Caldilineaceae bacterium]
MVTRRVTLTIGIFVTTFGLLVGCTRNRPTPEPTTAAADPQITVLTTTQGVDPVVTVASPAVAATSVPTVASTPAQLTPTTIDYYVQEGDTLLSVAQKFQVEVETVRQLNYLLDDKIFVGQILQMPYREGITAEGAPTPTPEPYRYVVEDGDSLGTIAQQFGVSAVSIMETNNLQNPNNVFVGQVLVIPNYVPPSSNVPTEATGATGSTTGATDTETGNAQGVDHVVQPGETLYGIAQKYGVDANAIASVNNIVNRNQLRVGQKLLIPGISQREAAAALGRIHIVQSGESLSAIAQLYGVSAQEITSFNNISNPDTIYVGQELIIPGQ